MTIKDENPRSRASIFSAIFFLWTIPIFVKGYKKQLTEEDLCQPLEEHRSSKLGGDLEDAWNKQRKLCPRPSLVKVLVKFFLPGYAFVGFLHVLHEILGLCQIISLGKLIKYFTPDQTDVTLQHAYYYATAIVTITILNATISHSFMINAHHIGMKLRVACCSLLYRKALRLNTKAFAEITTGHLVNLLSNDVNRFDSIVEHGVPLVLSPFLVSLTLCMIYLHLGWISCVGIAVFVIFIPIQLYVAKKISHFRLKTALLTDERVRLMNEIISGLKVIKMYTWEKAFEKLVSVSRRCEMTQIKGSSYLKGIILSFTVFTVRFALFVAILTYILLGNDPNGYFIFLTAAFYNSIRIKMTLSVPSAMYQLAEAKVAVSRIRKILLCEEKEELADTVIVMNVNKVKKMEGNCNLGFVVDQSDINDNDKGIKITNASSKWCICQEDGLQKINIKIKNRELLGIVGPVGSGKTTLLHMILKELSLTEGSVVVNGTLSYSSQEPWLFCDSVRENIVFGGKFNLKKYEEVLKICCLKRDIASLPHGDATIVGEKGVTLSGGQKARINLARAIYKNADIYLLDDPFSAVDSHVGKEIFENCILNYLKNKCVVLATHQLQYLRHAHRIVVLEKGRLAKQGTYQEIRDSGYFGQLNNHSYADKKTTRNDSEYSATLNNNIKIPDEEKEIRGYGDISWKVYQNYIEAGGGICWLFLVLFLFGFAQLMASGSDYFITIWVNLEQTKQEKNISITEKHHTVWTESILTREICFYVYSAVISMTIITSFLRSLIFFKFCLRSSAKLHNSMFSNIIYSPLSFFNKNPSGRILNRFSKDMGEIDEILPPIITDTLQLGFSVLGMIILVGISNPWLYMPILFIIIILIMLRKFYLSTSRDIKRLEGITRSPVFTHVNTSLQGLTTIRAFKAQEALKKQFDTYQDVHSSAYYMFLACTRAFGLWLDTIVSLYVGIVTFSFLLTKSPALAGNVGLSVTQVLGMVGVLQWGMRQWGNLENQMTSVERISEYTEIKPEVAEASVDVGVNFVTEGNLEFKAVSMRYLIKEACVLKNIRFNVKPKEKIGIVGRTGAGKSSLITALFQLTPTLGDILIDGVNIKTISLQNLRSQISIIPQEPMLFSSSLRTNLDPFEEFSDDEIWNALEEVELKPVVTNFSLGLEQMMSEGGLNLSIGQRQLLCLARAIIRKNKILILDEATSNVDHKTDALIQSTIRRKFKNCTVLTIAHRLHTVMDSDKVMVMHDGFLVEFEHPHVLLQNKYGMLYNLVEQTGKEMAENLHAIAKSSYQELFEGDVSL